MIKSSNILILKCIMSNTGFTIRDLLTHRSGLGLGAGDLMIWPDGSNFATDIIQNLQYLKPVSGFRTKYDYDNLLYIVAGRSNSCSKRKSWGILSKSVLWNR
jgi:hypothetical protein